MKILIFDFDGTIANTSDLIIDVIGQHIPGFNRSKYINLSRAYYEDKKFLSYLKVLYYELFLLGRIKKIRHIINERILDTSPIAGIQEVLDKLKTKSDLYIISSNFPENISQFLKKNNMDYFKEVYGEGSLFHKAKTISEVKKKYLKADEIYYIGDELRDMQAARKANVKEVGVTWGMNSKKDFEEFGTKVILEKVEQLLELAS